MVTDTIDRFDKNGIQLASGKHIKADLISDYVCRLIQYMDRNGWQVATPRNHNPTMAREPFLKMQSNYIQRALSTVSQQGTQRPWKLYQNYFKDLAAFKLTRIDDKALVFSNPVSHGYDYDSLSQESVVNSNIKPCVSPDTDSGFGQSTV